MKEVKTEKCICSTRVLLSSPVICHIVLIIVHALFSGNPRLMLDFLFVSDPILSLFFFLCLFLLGFFHLFTVYLAQLYYSKGFLTFTRSPWSPQIIFITVTLVLLFYRLILSHEITQIFTRGRYNLKHKRLSSGQPDRHMQVHIAFVFVETPSRVHQ